MGGVAKRNPRHTIFSNTVSYTKLHFPTKLYQNLAKIAKVSHLGGFWVRVRVGVRVMVRVRVRPLVRKRATVASYTYTAGRSIASARNKNFLVLEYGRVTDKKKPTLLKSSSSSAHYRCVYHTPIPN